MDRPGHSSISVSAVIGEATALAESSGFLSTVRDKVVSPFVNAAILEPWNGAASSINDISKSAGGKDLCQEAPLFHTTPDRLFSRDWCLQGISTGVGTLVPLGLTVLATRGGLLRAAGASENAFANFLRKESTATVLGATLYEGFRKPKKDETRAGNALGAASGFALFEYGNYLASGLPGIQKAGVRCLTGAAGSALHVTVSDLASNQNLPSGAKYKERVLSGAVTNTLLPLALNRFIPRVEKSNAALVEEQTGAASSAKVVDSLPTSSNLQSLCLVEATPIAPGIRPRVLLAEGAPRDAFFPWPSREHWITGTRVSRDAIIDFHDRVSTTVREFRSSQAFPRLKDDFSALLRQTGDVRAAGTDLLNQINARRFVTEQLAFRELSNQVRMREVLRIGNDFLPVYEQWLVQRNALLDSTRQFMRRPEMRAAQRGLNSAVGSLGEELGIPPVKVTLGRLGKKTDGEYIGGSGTEVLHAKRLFNASEKQVSKILGHETAHGYQDVLVIRYLADELGLGAASPEAVHALRNSCQSRFGASPTESWSRAVLAARNGKRLKAPQAEEASRLLSDASDVGSPTPGQIQLEGAINYFRNPRVDQPVTNLVQQMREWYVRDDLFGRKPPKLVTDLEALGPVPSLVETPQNKADILKLFTDRRGLLEAERYAAYRRSVAELDAWGFEDKIRRVLSGRKNGS